MGAGGGLTLRIAFLVNRDIESNLALNLLLPELHQSEVGVFPTEGDLIRFAALGRRLFDREDVRELLESYRSGLT